MIPPAPSPASTTRSADAGEHERSRGDYPRALLVGLAVSLVLHVFALLAYRSMQGPAEVGFEPADAPPVAEMTGIEVVDLLPAEEEELRPDDPVTPTEAAPTTAPIEAEIAEEEAIAEPEIERPGGVTAAERVRATSADPRLTTPIPDDLLEPTAKELAWVRIAWAIEEIADSTARARAEAAGLTDWTFTDDDGKRWGIADGKLYLGDTTLPLPQLGAPYDPDAWKGSMLADLERAAGSAAAWETVQDRIRAIRERVDAERRRAQQQDTTSGGGGRFDR